MASSRSGHRLRTRFFDVLLLPGAGITSIGLCLRNELPVPGVAAHRLGFTHRHTSGEKRSTSRTLDRLLGADEGLVCLGPTFRPSPTAGKVGPRNLRWPPCAAIVVCTLFFSRRACERQRSR